MGSDQEKVAQKVNEIISEMMNRVMERVLVADPFVPEIHQSNKPLYAALVPDEIFKGSHFERRFVTPFGSVWEKLTMAVAKEFHQNCTKGYTCEGTIGAESLRRIQEVLNKLEHNEGKGNRVKPNWKEELTYIIAGGGEPIPVSVVCDIYIESKKDNLKYAFELKAPLPNSDQTKVSKEKMFKLLAMDQHLIDKAFFALPYNPYGTKENYNWPFPKRWFDMKNDESVLIGDEFWELIGGKGTYESFIKEVNLLGREYRERIYKEFLGIDPPDDFEDSILK
ncbi:hypothetical protein G159_19415 [Planococcus glaciei CHR43]|uniref:TdeIII family type II restriction endonuclease n=1 Tax=Planococcus glaciei TaxID=459472 RepID=UPI0003DF32FD|nr:TdeIII family type II restriction endonuclease [Planococcus glaciei]ETP67316.1 hypothetical protein G159_19415 [Planococcus glaciei CHR43]